MKFIVSILLLAGLTAQAGEIKVRPAAVAGSWYSAEATELAADIDGLLRDAKPQQAPADSATIRALLVPHAGYAFSGAAAATGYQLLKGRAPRRVVVIGPAHRGYFKGLSIADVEAYATPLGQVPLDLDAVARLRESPLVRADAEAHRREHSIEIQLPLLQRTLAEGWKLVPILVGHMEAEDYARAAQLLKPLLDAETLLVLSGDFTHYGPQYGYQPFPPDAEVAARLRELDSGALAKITARDPAGLLAYQAETGITACALGPALILTHLLPASANVTLVNYTTSGEATGSYVPSVSYVTLAVNSAQPLAATEESVSTTPAALLRTEDLQRLQRIAQATLQARVAGQAEAEQTLAALTRDLPEALKKPTGTFVTLKKNGELRGCIGHILPVAPLYQSIMDNALSAALRDRRFYPVSAAEVAELEVEVSVLTEPQPIASHEEIKIGEHGVILEKDGRRAVFLPEVAVEQGWNREQTLAHLARKAGLAEDAWREGAHFQVFSTQKYSQ